MSNLTSDPQGAGQPLFSSEPNAAHALGERMVTSDGRVFRYAKAGAADLVAGNLLQSAAQIPNHQDRPIGVAGIGATTVVVTIGATPATLNQYAGGYMVITVAPGLGQTYSITGNAVPIGSNVTLTLGEPLRVAVTAATRVDLIANAYNGVIQAPIALTGPVAGVAVYPILANQYGWVQRSGPAAVLTAGANAVGGVVAAPGSVAGAVVVGVAGAVTVGSMMTTGAAGETNAVMLALE